jgi:hypothetical protein
MTGRDLSQQVIPIHDPNHHLDLIDRICTLGESIPTFIMNNDIITPFGRILFEEGIQYVYINQQVELTTEMLEQIHDLGLRMSGGKKYAVLADLRKDVTSTPEARVFGADNKYMSHHLAYGIMGNSVPVKLMINLFIQFNKPKVPSKLFTDEATAVKWLKEALKEMVVMK